MVVKGTLAAMLTNMILVTPKLIARLRLERGDQSAIPAASQILIGAMALNHRRPCEAHVCRVQLISETNTTTIQISEMIRAR